MNPAQTPICARAAALACALAAPLAFGHVSIDPAQAEAGAAYRGVLRVGHGCDAAETTALDVQLPGAATRTLPAAGLREVPVEFTAPAKPGPLWIKVVQRCGAASVSWSDVPAQGTSTAGMKTPAVLLQVMGPQEMAAASRLPAIRGGWVRSTVQGQSATGAFMTITASEPMEIVGVQTPVAGVAEVHEMAMEGNVMRMRAMPKLSLPAGKAVELKPGGYHLMLQDLKQPLAAGTTVPVTLTVRDAKGQTSRIELKLPVALQPPDGAAMPPGHKH